MVVPRAPDQKPLTLKPLERALSADGAGQRLMRGLGRPGADERLERLKLGNLSKNDIKELKKTLEREAR